MKETLRKLIATLFPPLFLSLLIQGCGAPPLSERVSVRWPYKVASPPDAVGRGVVVSDAALATEIGLQTLSDGGNAVDAAVATAFALAVVYPEAGNIGGGGFALVYLAEGTAAALDFREKAPLASHASMYLDSLGELTDGSVTGHLASGVPGSVAGLWALHKRYGTTPWKNLLAPAIRLADDGFEINQRFATLIAEDLARLSRFPGSARLFIPDGVPLRAGSRWQNPDLASALQRIAEEGPTDFYEGETADLIVSEIRRGRGIITHEDLSGYAPRWRDPVLFTYRGHTVISMPPPSSGGITLAIIANIMEGYDAPSLGWGSVDLLHLTAEAMRRAFAVRNAILADPDFTEIPQRHLLSQEFADSLRATIDPTAATPSGQLGVASPPREGNHTTHISVTDPHGNAVALTTTINELFGSAVTVEGAGFLLNDEMDDFTTKAGAPNMMGLVQSEANMITPEKRMLSAMTPTIILDRQRKPFLITGARGGPRIISSVFHVMSNVIDHNCDAPASVHLPRLHHQHLPDTLRIEADGFPAERVEELRERGHVVKELRYFGAAPSILKRDSLWQGSADPRTGGTAGGI
jgi:gamma-glutamyltranspeptidase/glutathione hydrolase